LVLWSLLSAPASCREPCSRNVIALLFTAYRILRIFSISGRSFRVYTTKCLANFRLSLQETLWSLGIPYPPLPSYTCGRPVQHLIAATPCFTHNGLQTHLQFRTSRQFAGGGRATRSARRTSPTLSRPRLIGAFFGRAASRARAPGKTSRPAECRNEDFETVMESNSWTPSSSQFTVLEGSSLEKCARKSPSSGICCHDSSAILRAPTHFSVLSLPIA
jgi:hypothetical protein